MVVDSAAELHVCPKGFHCDDGLQSKVPGRDLVGMGGNSLNYQCERKIKTTLCDDNKTSIPATELRGG